MPLWALLMLLGAALGQQARAQTAPERDFDHLRTGFALSGAHTQARCESCHVGGVFKGTPRDCDSCHQGGTRFSRNNVVKPGTHVVTTQACDSCHNTRSFSGARMNHAGVARGTCASCHNGVQASGKPGGHVRTTASCDTCHGNSAWRPAQGFDHSGVAPGSCATCHNGSTATGRGASHPPYTQVASLASAACGTCHKSGFRAWTPARLHGSVTVVTQCSACHLSARPNNATHAGQTACETCHRSTSTWGGARVDHATFTAATVCSSCHNGSAATGRGASHTPYQLVASLASLDCDNCHRVTGWTPARVHGSATVTAQCSACHLSARPNNATHAGQTACETCHRSTSTWAGARVDHATFTAATVCSSCHNGSAASGKTAAHIPSGTTNCISCHTTTSWRPARFSHTLVTAGTTCKSCHNGSYVSQGATAKPANHIPEAQLLGGAAMDCNGCHTSTTSWAQRMNHNGSLGGGAGWCKGCHASGTNYSGGLERKSLTHERKTPPAIDCSESGCHRPLGNKGSAYSKWD